MTDRQLINQLIDQVRIITDENKRLNEELAMLKHRFFGRSSEKADALNQLSLFDETPVEPLVPQAETTVKTHTRKAPKPLAERLNPELVEQTDVVYRLTDEHCPDCGTTLTKIGKSFTHTSLRFIPARLIQENQYLQTYKCSTCSANSHIDGDRFIKPAAPQALIAHSVMTPSLLTTITSEKFLSDVPLYRQRSAWKRRGWDTSVASPSTDVIKGSDYLAPLYNLFHQELLQQDYLHGNETPIQVLKEPDKSPTSKSYLWLMNSIDAAKQPLVYFAYEPSRSGATAARLYEGFTGTLQCDGYSGYHALPETICQVGCWAHVRRKFVDATHGSQKGLATQAVKQIDQWFAWERQWSKLSADKRLAKRQSETKPAVEHFWAWLTELTTLPNSSLGKAVTDAIKQRVWDITRPGKCVRHFNYLTVYLTGSHAP